MLVLDSPDLYTIGWVAALHIERAAATALLDDRHGTPEGFEQHQADTNSYTWGRIGEHNIVIASLPAGGYGTTSAATTASNLLSSLPQIRIGLLVGIGGGIARPDQDRDIRLGDVVVGQPDGTAGGVIQYDLGKAKMNQAWARKGSLDKPPAVLLSALSNLQAEHEFVESRIPDLLQAMWKANPKMKNKVPGFVYQGLENNRLFKSTHEHAGGSTCAQCEPSGEIAEAAGEECLCFEMEAAGLMNHFSCLVIRGICDYADSHKNDRWQRYASATAAAYAKELLSFVPTSHLQTTQRAVDVLISS
ncbi:ankyrin repeat protein [Dactylonectria estremocensis]|uniref:Ankyrin repeat protein n=1 Tax=Dactylonectria estremocensis TaxID=1079267 RepID=A0A9P9DU61_9HYPO|nr:ankyrin repeat protein [Dactylonectria estremocensis]